MTLACAVFGPIVVLAAETTRTEDVAKQRIWVGGLNQSRNLAFIVHLSLLI